MPVTPAIAESNRAQTERLRTLAGRLTPDQLAVRLPNGWTVAVALAHVAFWDRQRLCLLQRWAAGDWCDGGYSGELFNEALLPVFELLPADRVGRLAVETAEHLDALLLAASDDLLRAALARPDKPYLDRGAHRGYHLDQIERALAPRDAAPDATDPSP